MIRLSFRTFFFFFLIARKKSSIKKDVWNGEVLLVSSNIMMDDEGKCWRNLK